ncbi:sensor histidine kinase RegB [Marinibacterium profundimaris]|uniref:histidine kinase n=1 Tax=Marinibacterium profundimaris TaxID=1679460 RepID=A0A225NVJ9_9RHOB|nr:ActS/PrrB/RegB family redox-sensitive histidine kinase [Marinibacterium profundimaris]OWU75806.1 histidine kinase [Marinibacterium profundimaris]
MQQSELNLRLGQQRGNWIRLRTLILLRWVAIVGQVTAITVAERTYHLMIDLGPCLMAVGVAVIGNLVAMFVYPENKRLTETENFLMVLFDLLQLSALLFLTGGLHNPFSVLLLAPVTIAANVLSLRSTMLIGGTAIVIVTLLAEFHLPLRTEEGVILRVPDIFVFGSWLSLIIATIFMALYSRRVSSEMNSMSDALTATQMALAREQKLTDLGGVVAAAAHELGTPLATIKLASAELMEELDDRPDLRDDAALIREQADRCRDILRDMGRAGKDDLHLRQAPLSAVLEEAAEPHMHRGKCIHFEDGPGEGGALQQPSILRMPEVIHGMRNLIQNAVDFARGNVWVESMWTEKEISVRILDDGDGFPPHLIGRIGDPFVRRRRGEAEPPARPEYEGMGLGLFIAKTLLERSGAELSFANGTDPFTGDLPSAERRGAIVEVVWPRDKIDGRSGSNAVPLGANRPIRA